jgi:hypothetical protein
MIQGGTQIVSEGRKELSEKYKTDSLLVILNKINKR